MPLIKKYCMKCWKETIEERYEWIENDEFRWQHGWIICPTRYLGKKDSNPRKIKAEPPKNCPYLLEYVLNQRI